MPSDALMSCRRNDMHLSARVFLCVYHVLNVLIILGAAFVVINIIGICQYRRNVDEDKGLI